MGFMDKAKKLAEQAQEKLDETQKNFNKGQGGSEGQPGQGGGVKYDEHGRPIQQDTPAAATPPPTATPAPSAPAPDPTTPPAATEEPKREDPPSGGANSSPDPFKPIQ